MKSEKWLLLAAVALLFCSCASSETGVTSAGPREIPEDIAGIVHAGRTNTQKEYDYLNYLNTRWMLNTFNWESIEPEPGEWDFLSYDVMVNNANKAGIKVLGILAYDHWWNNKDKDTHRYISPDQLSDYIEYVRRTVEHFRGRVDAWCIWNEPNFSHFWKGGIDDFILLSRTAADTIKETDPDVIILGGAFNRGVTGLPEKFARELFESGAMDKADAVAFHPYELNPARTMALYNQFKEIVDDYGFGDKIWITEVGYPTGGWYPTKTTEKKFPEYVVKTFVNLATAGVPKILWYQLFDPHKRKSKDSEDFFGLVRSRRDYTSKGAEAFRLCSIYLGGTVYRPDLPRREGLPNSLQTFYFERTEGGGTLVLWKEGASTKVNLSVFDLGFTGNFAVHDAVSGDTVTMSALNTVITVGSMPVFVTW